MLFAPFESATPHYTAFLKFRIPNPKQVQSSQSKTVGSEASLDSPSAYRSFSGSVRRRSGRIRSCGRQDRFTARSVRQDSDEATTRCPGLWDASGRPGTGLRGHARLTGEPGVSGRGRGLDAGRAWHAGVGRDSCARGSVRHTDPEAVPAGKSRHSGRTYREEPGESPARDPGSPPVPAAAGAGPLLGRAALRPRPRQPVGGGSVVLFGPVKDRVRAGELS